MNILGIGPPEMMIIAVLALLVFGPGKLPEVMGQAGKMVRDFRRMSAELSGEFEKTIAEARDATSGLTAELGGMSKEVNSITNSVKKDLGIKGGTVTSKSSSTAKKTTGSSTSSSSTSKAKSTTSSSTSKTASTTAGKSSSTTTTTSNSAAAAKKPATPVASREDPAADMSLFDLAPVERKPRARRAVPSVINDPTPRIAASTPALDDVEVMKETTEPANDAVARARQRRRSAGYARPSA